MNKENVKNNRIVRHTYYYFNSVFNRKRLRHKAETTIEKFGIEYPSEEVKNNQIKDMIRMNQLYGFTFDEYLYYQFADKTVKERLTFVADWEHLGYTCVMNNPDNAEIFDNKWKTYETYQPYYCREIQLCSSVEDKKTFMAFLSKHSSGIVKPLDATCGHGVRIIKGGASEENEQQYEDILKGCNGRFIIEELIHQSDEMGKFHPSSVNTVRVPTIKVGDTVNVVNPFFRIGQHGNMVDNVGAGGILCTVDSETGIIFAAADEIGKRFVSHPDTGEKIIGFKIPEWDDAKKLVTKLANVVPDNHYTGWDLALTDNGWVLVEANRRGQFVWQIASLKGFREEIDCYLKQLGVKY